MNTESEKLLSAVNLALDGSVISFRKYLFDDKYQKRLIISDTPPHKNSRSIVEEYCGKWKNITMSIILFQIYNRAFGEKTVSTAISIATIKKSF